MRELKYSHEYQRRLRAGLIGCGCHAHAGLLPALSYAPFDLVAVCDANEDHARAVGRQYGATGGTYSDYRQMLRCERLDVAFVNLAPGDQASSPGDIAAESMESGCHVWMARPPGNTLAELNQVIAARAGSGRSCIVSLKEVFSPVVEKMKEITERREFGRLGSASATYPVRLPPASGRTERSESMRRLVEELWHPAGVLHHLCGAAASITYEESDGAGDDKGGAAVIEFCNGAVGSIHFACVWPQLPYMGIERYEVVGQNSKAVAGNPTDLVWYRGYERSGVPYPLVWNFIEGDDSAALRWRPELTRVAPYNSSIFLTGIGQEVVDFGERLIVDETPTRGTVEDFLEIVRWSEIFFQPPGSLLQLLT